MIDNNIMWAHSLLGGNHQPFSFWAYTDRPQGVPSPWGLKEERLIEDGPILALFMRSGRRAYREQLAHEPPPHKHIIAAFSYCYQFRILVKKIYRYSLENRYTSPR